MKIADLRTKTEGELATQLLDLKKESFNLRFQKINGELEKTSRIREVRRSIAQVNTLLNEKKSNDSPKKSKTKKVKKDKETNNA